MRRVLFTGSRDWVDVDAVRVVIDALPADTMVIHGKAPGLDMIVDRLARARGLKVDPYPADWTAHGHGAGPIRNQQMIDEGRPTDAYAFPGPFSRGTWDMVNKLRKAGVPTVVKR